jgi:hypothetical protein
MPLSPKQQQQQHSKADDGTVGDIVNNGVQRVLASLVGHFLQY